MTHQELLTHDIWGHVGAIMLRLVSLAMATIAGAYINRALNPYNEQWDLYGDGWDFIRGLFFFMVACILMIVAYFLTITHVLPHIY